jgi:hypothetical protein
MNFSMSGQRSRCAFRQQFTAHSAEATRQKRWKNRAECAADAA